MARKSAVEKQSKQTAFVESGPSPTTFEPLLPGEEIAQRLGLDAKTVYELTRKRCLRPLPFYKVGKYLRFKWSEVETWLAEGRKAA